MFLFNHYCSHLAPTLIRLSTTARSTTRTSGSRWCYPCFSFMRATYFTSIDATTNTTSGYVTRKIRKIGGDELKHKQFEVFQFFNEGAFNRKSLNMREMTKALPKGFRLRDLRGTSGRQISQILVREGHYWVIAEHLMAVVTAENMILFRANSQNVSEFAEQLADILRINSRKGGTQDQSIPSQREPFELVVLEEMLSSIVKDYDSRMNLLIPVVQGTLRSYATTNSGSTEDAVVRMIPMTNTLNNFQTAIAELRSAIEDVLQSEADLTNLCLTNKDRATRVEVEMLLENFSKKTEELYNEIQEILSNIQTTKKAIEMTMSNTRNQLMRLNLHISLMTLTLTFSAVITGIFGMNLVSGLENNPHMFYYVATAIPLLALIIYTSYEWYNFGNRRKLASVTKLTLSSTFYDNISSTKYLKNLANKSREDFQAVLEQASGGNNIDASLVDELQRKIKDKVQPNTNNSNHNNNNHVNDDMEEEKDTTTTITIPTTLFGETNGSSGNSSSSITK